MVIRILGSKICRPSRFHKLSYKPFLVAARAFGKTEWTKPRFVGKPYSEQRTDPPPPTKPATRLDEVQYDELRCIWEELQYELYNASLNGMKLIFTSMASCEKKNIYVKKNEQCVDHVSVDKQKEEERRRVDSIMRTYIELASLISTPYVKKTRNTLAEETLEQVTLYTEAGESKVNTTTANQDDGERLTQKVETIEEVPLVEAEPDIIRPPKTTGPTVMNISNQTSEAFEDNGINSDFQIYDEFAFYDPKARALELATAQQNSNAKDCREITKNSDLDHMCLLDAVLPDIKVDQFLPLSELLQRVRLRNRLLRCHEIQTQLTSAETSRTPSYPRPPMYDHRPLNPPGYMPKPQTVPVNPWPQYPRAEPMTPRTCPCPNCPKRTNVSSVNLALYLGPLISPFKNASLFPLMTIGMKLHPKADPITPDNRVTNVSSPINLALFLGPYKTASLFALMTFGTKMFPTESTYKVKLTDVMEMLKRFSDILGVYVTLEARHLQVNVQPNS